MKRIVRTSALKSESFIKDRFFICLLFLFGIGMLIGAVFVAGMSTDKNSIVFKTCLAYFESRGDKSALSLFFGTLWSSLLWLGVAYVLGVCAVGTPFLCSVPVFEGIGKGMIFGFAAVEYGFFGFLKSVLLIGVQGAAIAFIILSAVRKSAKMSRQTRRAICLQPELNPFLTLRKFNLSYILYIICALFFSIADALMSRLTFLIIK